MTDLADFLLARIAEDEAVARAATQDQWVPTSQGWNTSTGTSIITAPYHDLDIWPDDVLHITRWQPARVLAECAAKRRIVDAVTDLSPNHTAPETFQLADGVLYSLALPYADHPDYDEAWRG